MIAPNVPPLESIRSEFAGFLPELTGRLNGRFRQRRFEARADAVAEGVGLAWLLFLSARRRNKSVGPGTLAFYAGRSVESGRKVSGNSDVDALADTPLSRQRVGRHVSMDGPGISAAAFYMTFGDKRSRWPVVEYVAPRIDLEAFLAGCTARERQIVAMKLQGYRQTEIAAALRVTPPAVHQRLASLRRRWEAMLAT